MSAIFIYNPESGAGKLERYKSYLQSKLSEKYGEITWLKTEKPMHAYELAKTYGKDCDYLFVSGGDGTLNEVVNGISQNEKKPIVGYIPSGTVNDVARSLGISRNIKKAANILVNGEVFEHDIFKVNNKYGIYVCCAGLFTRTSYETKRFSKKKLGKLAYLSIGIKELFQSKPIPIELETEKEVIKTHCSLLLILNSKSIAGFKSNNKAELNDGLVELMIFKTPPKRISLNNINKIFETFLFGIKSTKKSKNVIYRTLSDFTIKIDDKTVINLDGESSTKGTFSFKCIQKGIKILTPQKRTKEKLWKRKKS